MRAGSNWTMKSMISRAAWWRTTRDSLLCYSIISRLCSHTFLLFCLKLQQVDRIVGEPFHSHYCYRVTLQNAEFDCPPSICFLLCHFLSSISSDRQGNGWLCIPMSRDEHSWNHGPSSGNGNKHWRKGDICVLFWKLCWWAVLCDCSLYV